MQGLRSFVRCRSAWISVLVLFALSLVGYGVAHAAYGSNHRLGTVAALHTHRTHVTVALRSHGRLITVSLGPGFTVMTRDGHLLAPTSLRPGDDIQWQHGQIIDLSQVWTQVRGIVSLVPNQPGDPLAVQTDPQHTLLIDLGRSTSITGLQGSIRPGLVEQSDTVQVNGALDQHLGEMTQTAVVQETTDQPGS